jgi:hypothetical protein
MNREIKAVAEPENVASEAPAWRRPAISKLSLGETLAGPGSDADGGTGGTIQIV